MFPFASFITNYKIKQTKTKIENVPIWFLKIHIWISSLILYNSLIFLILLAAENLLKGSIIGPNRQNFTEPLLNHIPQRDILI